MAGGAKPSRNKAQVSRQRTCLWLLRAMCPFLKEFVKQKRFSSGWLRNGSVGAHVAFSSGSAAVIPALLPSSRYRAPSRLSSLRCGKLQSFFSQRDCSQHIPSRGTVHDNREQLRRGLGLGR